MSFGVIRNGDPVRKVINDNDVGDITVPTGEVWSVQMVYKDTGTGAITVNGVNISRSTANDVYHTAKTTFVGGDVISSRGSQRGIICGYDVSGIVDNNPVSVQLDGESVTVPTGETWECGGLFYLGGAGSVTLNGNAFNPSSTEAFDTPLVLSGGDTLNVGGHSGHIGGFEV